MAKARAAGPKQGRVKGEGPKGGELEGGIQEGLLRFPPVLPQGPATLVPSLLSMKSLALPGIGAFS